MDLLVLSTDSDLPDILSKLLKLSLSPTTAKRNKQSVSNPVQKLEKELANVETELNATLKPLEKLREENEYLEEKLNERNMDEKTKKRNKSNLELEHAALLKYKINSQDDKLLKDKKLRYTALRNNLQVKFSFSDLENNVLSGYVFNRFVNKIQCFEINNLTNMSEDEVASKIYEVMEQTSNYNNTMQQILNK